MRWRVVHGPLPLSDLDMFPGQEFSGIHAILRETHDLSKFRNHCWRLHFAVAAETGCQAGHSCQQMPWEGTQSWGPGELGSSSALAQAFALVYSKGEGLLFMFYFCRGSSVSLCSYFIHMRVWYGVIVISDCFLHLPPPQPPGLSLYPLSLNPCATPKGLCLESGAHSAPSLFK